MAKSGITSGCVCVCVCVGEKQLGSSMKIGDKVSNELNIILCVDELILGFAFKYQN